MRLLNNPSEQVSKPSWGCLAFMAAIALSVSSCISIQDTDSINQTLQKDEMSECDIDNPVYIALVGISAEIQAGISNPEESSLQFMWEYTSKRLKEMNILDPVSVSLIPPRLVDGLCAYAVIEVAGQKALIAAKDEKTAVAETREAQEFCIEYMRNRIEMSLGGNPATRDTLKEILVNEEGVFTKHRITAEIVPDKKRNSWTISFVGDDS